MNAPHSLPLQGGLLAALMRRFGRICRSPRAVAAAFLFFANGFILSNFFVRLPAVKDTLGLGESQLGLALLFFAIGGVVSMPLGGALAGRFGSARVAVIAGLAVSTLITLPGLATSLPLLAGALVLCGLANGAMDVSMNAQADAAEAAVGLRIMSFCHAMFSLGFAAGTLPGGLFAAAAVPVSLHLFAVGVPTALLILLAARVMSPDRVIDGPPQPHFALPRGPLLFFGLICLCGAIVEGAMYDWTAVYVEETRLEGPAAAALAYAVFAVSMFCARLFGDVITERFGAALAVRAGLLLASVGLVIALLSPAPVYLVGFVGIGLGVAGVFPAVFRAAGRLPGRAPGPSMAAAVTLGYTGFLMGPPAIGFAAGATSLTVALMGLIPLCLIGAALAGTLRLGE